MEKERATIEKSVRKDVEGRKQTTMATTPSNASSATVSACQSEAEVGHCSSAVEQNHSAERPRSRVGQAHGPPPRLESGLHSATDVDNGGLPQIHPTGSFLTYSHC